MKSILILLHCESNTGYAIAPLEATFFRMALQACRGDAGRIHFAYPSMAGGPTSTLPADFRQYTIIDSRSEDVGHCESAEAYIREHHIDTIFGFDQPVSRTIYKYFRRAGVRYFLSYWGAPMSSIFGPIKRAFKRIEVALRIHGPDHYIFESQGMADTAIRGRGISPRRISVIYQAVDTDRFKPDPKDAHYVYEKLAIPRERRVFIFCGHMEPRKGVAVIMHAANRLASQRSHGDWQFVLFGNKSGEERPYWEMLTLEAQRRVLFGGYRGDIDRILRGCYAGIVASTGWDSFPRSAIEGQSTGVPLLVSDLPGLNESVIHGETGFIFPIGDSEALAARAVELLESPPLQSRLSLAARTRAEQRFAISHQEAELVKTLLHVAHA